MVCTTQAMKVVNAGNTGSQGRQEEQKFKVVFNHLESLRASGGTWRPASKQLSLHKYMKSLRMAKSDDTLFRGIEGDSVAQLLIVTHDMSA